MCVCTCFFYTTSPCPVHSYRQSVFTTSTYTRVCSGRHCAHTAECNQWTVSFNV